MRRRLNLRQIEAFKAVIEHGTASAAAAVLHVSQPAMSKLIAHLEADAALRLFDRAKGRLTPTEQGMRLYAEVDRIFSGVQQVENAVDVIRRQAQGRLAIGVMPALSGGFVQRAVTAFLQIHPGTYCVIESRSSQSIMDSLVDRKLDVGFVEMRMSNPYVAAELLMEHPSVCIMPPDHPLAAKRVVRPKDLADVPFVSYDPEGITGQRVGALLAAHGVRPNIALVTNISLTVCEFVAAGAGVSLEHPVVATGFRGRIAARRFEPASASGFLLCHGRESRNARLVESFLDVARATGRRMLAEALAATAKQRRPRRAG